MRKLKIKRFLKMKVSSKLSHLRILRITYSRSTKIPRPLLHTILRILILVRYLAKIWTRKRRKAKEPDINWVATSMLLAIWVNSSSFQKVIMIYRAKRNTWTPSKKILSKIMNKYQASTIICMQTVPVPINSRGVAAQLLGMDSKIRIWSTALAIRQWQIII